MPRGTTCGDTPCCWLVAWTRERTTTSSAGTVKVWPNDTPSSSQLESSYKIKTYFGGWQNGTPNSRQLEPSYKIKTCIGGWPNDTAKSSQLARKHSIV